MKQKSHKEFIDFNENELLQNEVVEMQKQIHGLQMRVKTLREKIHGLQMRVKTLRETVYNLSYNLDVLVGGDSKQLELKF
jgi:archaellum component FlaC